MALELALVELEALVVLIQFLVQLHQLVAVAVGQTQHSKMARQAVQVVAVDIFHHLLTELVALAQVVRVLLVEHLRLVLVYLGLAVVVLEKLATQMDLVKVVMVQPHQLQDRRLIMPEAVAVAVIQLEQVERQLQVQRKATPVVMVR